MAQVGEEIYYLGIIDILQKYNRRKKVEHLFKSVMYNAHDISAVDPQEYAARFKAFIDKHVI